MAKYKVNWLIKGLVPGKKYLVPGDTVELDADVAARSVQVGSLEEIKPSVAPPTSPGASPNTPAGGEADAVNLQEMTKAQLVQYAAEKLGLSLDTNKSKAMLLAAIESAVGK